MKQNFFVIKEPGLAAFNSESIVLMYKSEEKLYTGFLTENPPEELRIIDFSEEDEKKYSDNWLNISKKIFFDNLFDYFLLKIIIINISNENKKSLIKMFFNY